MGLRLDHEPCDELIRRVWRDAYEFTTPFAWLRGLYFHKQKPACFIFNKPTRSVFHSFFFPHGFGLISLRDGHVQEWYELKPWHAWRPRRTYDTMLEIPLIGAYTEEWEAVRACLEKEVLNEKEEMKE